MSNSLCACSTVADRNRPAVAPVADRIHSSGAPNSGPGPIECPSVSSTQSVSAAVIISAVPRYGFGMSGDSLNLEAATAMNAFTAIAPVAWLSG